MYTDAHIHLHDLQEKTGIEPVLVESSLVCTSAWNKKEFYFNEDLRQKKPNQILLSFGIHPQNPDISEIPFLESLIKNKRISAIGECGFDFFTEAYRQERKAQELVWNLQLDMAVEYTLPLIIHARKAMPELFADSVRLAKTPAVIFHGWSGSAVEARSFLSRGVNAYFSAGKGLLRGQKSLIETIRFLPETRILAETDAPWMTSKGERYSVPVDIIQVYEKIAEIRGISRDHLKKIVFCNFKNAFAIPAEFL